MAENGQKWKIIQPSGHTGCCIYLFHLKVQSRCTLMQLWTSFKSCAKLAIVVVIIHHPLLGTALFNWTVCRIRFCNLTKTLLLTQTLRFIYSLKHFVITCAENNYSNNEQKTVELNLLQVSVFSIGNNGTQNNDSRWDAFFEVFVQNPFLNWKKIVDLELQQNDSSAVASFASAAVARYLLLHLWNIFLPQKESRISWANWRQRMAQSLLLVKLIYTSLILGLSLFLPFQYSWQLINEYKFAHSNLGPLPSERYCSANWSEPQQLPNKTFAWAVTSVQLCL